MNADGHRFGEMNGEIIRNDKIFVDEIRNNEKPGMA